MTDLAMLARDGIRRHAEWLILSAREINHHLRLLKAQPEWETTAEDAMHRAKQALVEATSILEDQIAAFKNLPVEK